MIKDFLFSLFGYLGFICIVLFLILMILELLNRIMKISKYVIMYKSYKKDKEVYKNRDNLIITNHGRILSSCATNTYNEDIAILEKAIEICKDKKRLGEKLKPI